MPTFKTVIHPRYKKADGVFRVKIRITHNKQSRYIPTCYYASSSEVNEKFDFKRGTSYVRDTMPIIDEYRKICNKCADKIETMNVDQIVELIKNYKEDENFKLGFLSLLGGGIFNNYEITTIKAMRTCINVHLTHLCDFSAE